MKKSWSELRFQKRESKTISGSILDSVHRLQNSVLTIGTTSSSSVMEAISGHVLHSELVGTKSYLWDINYPPHKVRDFTIDPYQDLLVLVEESVNG